MCYLKIILMKNLAILFFLIFCGKLALSQMTIKMEKVGGVYTVPCTINGLKLRFIFDTGADDVSISLTEARFMLKNGYLSSTDILGKEYFSDATGSISVGTKIIIKKIEFAGLTLQNVEASVVHELAAPLLLGQSAMRKIGIFQFDPNSGTLTILNAPKNSVSNPSSKESVKIELVENYRYKAASYLIIPGCLYISPNSDSECLRKFDPFSSIKKIYVEIIDDRIYNDFYRVRIDGFTGYIHRNCLNYCGK